MSRWRGRASGLAVLTLVAAVSAVSAVGLSADGRAPAAVTPPSGWQLVALDQDGEALVRAPLRDGHFTLRYRNSIYGSLAEERFRVDAAGRLELVELAADEAAVLDEYYETAGKPRRAGADDTRQWKAPPAEPLALAELALAATEHGQRTLVVDGQAIPLWQLTRSGAPTITLRAEESR